MSEESIDLTPGVVWTDDQLAVVKSLAARLYKAEAVNNRLLALADEFDAGVPWKSSYIGTRIREAAGE